MEIMQAYLQMELRHYDPWYDQTTLFMPFSRSNDGQS